jgi:type II secretory pathway component PulM
LLRAGARAAAAHRLADLHRYKIEPVRQQIEELTAELAAHHALAAQLCQLAGEYEYLHGAERATTPQPAAAGGKVQP